MNLASRISPIWALAVAVFAAGVDTYIVVGVLPEVARDLGEPIAAVGLIASAYALPTALLAPAFGPLSDRRGRRFAMLLGLSIFVAATAASAIAPGLLLLLLARAVNGLGSAIMFPAAYAYAGDLPDASERGRAMGVLSSAFPLATLLGLPIGALAATLFGWRGAFLFITLVGVVALLLVRTVLPPDRPRTEAPAGYLASYRRVLGDRSALTLLAVTFVWFLTPLGLFTFFAAFISSSYDIAESQAGLSLIVIGLVGVIASRVSGRVMGVIGPRNAVLFAITAFGIAVALMPLTTFALPVTLLAMMLWASGTWFGIPAINAIVAAHSQRFRGTMLAFNSSSLNLAGVFGPVLIGAIIATAGFGAAFWTAAIVAIIAFAFAFIVLPRPTATEASEPEPAAGA
jgi:predicted MFS family arabinose efflux permease